MSLEVDRRAALRAHAHPLRLRMLSLLTGAPMSAAELGRELDISQALASYHLRFLVDAGLLELAEEVVNRGGRERRYRHRVDTHAATSSAVVDDDSLDLMLAAAVEELRRRHRDRETGRRGLTVDAELWVSDDEWLAATAAVQEASVRLHEAAQRPRTPGTRRVNATVFMFGMASGEEPGS
jgi:DNA-binding transcriptional ArsR family regulator